jgi:Uma2 family endonuclease
MAIDVEITRRRFTLDEYHRMIEVGILREGDPVELIRGELIQKMTIGPRHAGCTSFLIARLVTPLAARAQPWPGNPIVITPDSEPEPDIVLVKPRADFYRTALPRPADVLLVIEVAESSIRYDRDVKRPLYAEAGIAEYWIVDLDAEIVEIHREPESGRYRNVAHVGRGGRIGPWAFPDIVLPVDEILG